MLSTDMFLARSSYHQPIHKRKDELTETPRDYVLEHAESRTNRRLEALFKWPKGRKQVHLRNVDRPFDKGFELLFIASHCQPSLTIARVELHKTP